MAKAKFGRRRIVVALAASVAGVQCAGAADILVEVTGSNIRRVATEGALPVQVITRAQIEAEGIQTAMGVVERLSANSSIGGINLSGSVGGTLVGYAAASLRGLGAPRTLVLLNGRRLANTSFSGTAVDINAIPLSAVQRVEVLTDGASAIYGTDAIAGVINFVLRQDFRGVEAFAYYGDSEQGGGETQRYNLTAGWGDLAAEKVNVFATVDYNKVGAIAASQRDFSSTAFLPNAPGGRFDRTSGNSAPGNAFVPSLGITRSPGVPGCLPPYSFPTSRFPQQCRFDFTSVINIVPPSESWNVYGSGRWQFAPDHQAFVEASWSRTESTSKASPAPVASSSVRDGQGIFTSPSSPYYPRAFAQQLGVDGETFEVFWRGLELGPRTDFNTIEQTRVVGGLKGGIAGWDYAVDVNWSRSTSSDEWKAGWVRESVLFPILNSGQINLFGLNGPDQVARMQQALVLGKVYDATGTMTDVNGKVSKEVYDLPAGPLAIALGVQYRREQYEFNSSPGPESGDVVGLGGSIGSIPTRSRNIYAAYAEANVPIAKEVEATLALRYDDYQGVEDGSTWNPKIGVRWQPSKQLLLRGAWGTGFRAPALIEQNQNNFGATGGLYDDPLRCPFTQSPRDCNTQFTTRLGGNPELKPETSQNWTAGFVIEPVPTLTFGAEYYWIRVKNIIGIPPEDPIFSDIAASERAGLIVRYVPGSPGCPASVTAGGLPCPIDYGVQDLVNLTQVTTSGVDVNLNWKLPPLDWGQFTINFQGTYVGQWDQQAEGGPTQKLAGSYAGGVAATVVGSGSTGAFPRWKHTANLGWAYGPWSANLNQTFVDHYTEPAVTTPTRVVGSYSLWGLNGAYKGFKGWTLAVGVKNLFDTAPPYTRQQQAFQVGYDPYLADPTGRFWWGSVRYAFQ